MMQQLWKVTHLSQNYYSIRPMNKLDMALHQSGNVVNISTISTGDSPATVNESTGTILTSGPGEMSTITVKKIYNGVSYSKSYTLIVEANSIFYSVTNAKHDHYSSLNTAYDAFSTNNITNIRHRSGAFSGNECKASLKCTKIFASRSHGWTTTDYTITGIKLDDAAPGVGAYLFSQSTNAMTSTSAVINSSDSFEKLELVLFIGCSTASRVNSGCDLVTRIIEQGAQTAIGFTEEIDCNKANTWTTAFFEELLEGKSVSEAVNLATIAVPGTKEGLDSAVIVGDSSLTIADLIS